MNGDDNPCFRAGPATGPRVIFVAPLFEEANRMRRTLVLAMRALAARGIASLMPDLPGQNDSLIATEAVDLDQWRAALRAQVAREDDPVIIASIRGGALIDDAAAAAAAWWRLAPADGAGLLRTMLRSRIASDREAGKASTMDDLLANGLQSGLMLAGNRIGPTMVAQLQSAVPAPCAPLRSLALGNGADAIAGSALWLRAEPGEDRSMASAIADDIANWMATCAIS